MSDWNSSLYLRFDRERTQPAIDLVNRIPGTPLRIVDLGCGPGNSTAVLRSRWPDAAITGVDSSRAMLERARATFPDEAWELADAGSWQPDPPPDLLFSNAALHWLPDHSRLMPRLLGCVAPGGWFAVQLPYHLESPLHQALFAVANAPHWKEALCAARNAMHVEAAARYYDLLRSDAAQLDVWITTYFHPMRSLSGVLDWIRATGLRPYLEVLADDGLRDRFERTLLERWRDVLPATADRGYLLPFPRLFLLAQRR